MEKQKVLLAEDDKNLGTILQSYLIAKGYPTDLCSDGEEAFVNFKKNEYSICILDVMMPIKDGFTLAKDIRLIDKEIPILFLTAKTLQEDKLKGFELGADDYITKPFSPRALVARVRAVLRRVQGDVHQPGIIRVGDLHIDLEGHRTMLAGVPLNLTRNEFKLLTVLAQHPGQTFSRAQLLENLHGVAYDGYDRSIDSHIKNLRRKIEKDLSQPYFIQTVYGVGNRLTDDE